MFCSLNTPGHVHRALFTGLCSPGFLPFVVDTVKPNRGNRDPNLYLEEEGSARRWDTTGGKISHSSETGKTHGLCTTHTAPFTTLDKAKVKEMCWTLPTSYCSDSQWNTDRKFLCFTKVSLNWKRRHTNPWAVRGECVSVPLQEIRVTCRSLLLRLSNLSKGFLALKPRRDQKILWWIRSLTVFTN